MTDALPQLPWTWTGEALVPPSPHWAKRAGDILVVGETYTLEERQVRSAKSHAHYFASVNDLWLSLPEGMTDNFPTPNHLRRHALIQAGYRDERSIVYPNYEAICMHMPHRTRYAVKRRAADLGVCAGRCGGSDPDARPWADEERALAAKWGAVIPGRSRFALVAFRNRNGIKVRRDTKPEARGRQQRAPKPRTPRPIPPPKLILLPVPKPVAWKRQGNEISPRVIAAAARSRHGIELIATLQRAVPRDVWPHLRPLVIEQVALGVMERRIDLSDLAGAVKTTVAALVAQQFSGAA